MAWISNLHNIFIMRSANCCHSLPATLRSCHLSSTFRRESWSSENWTVYQSVSLARSWLLLAVTAGEQNFSTQHHHRRRRRSSLFITFYFRLLSFTVFQSWFKYITSHSIQNEMKWLWFLPNLVPIMSIFRKLEAVKQSVPGFWSISDIYGHLDVC